MLHYVSWHYGDSNKFHLLCHIWSAVDRREVVTERKTRGEAGEFTLQKQVVTTDH